MSPTPSMSGRVAIRYLLEATITVESQSNFYTGFSQNISEGGVYVGMENPPAVGETVKLRVQLEDGLAVTATGVVRWHRVDVDGTVVGAGVQFVALEPESRDALQEMLARAAQEPLLME